MKRILCLILCVVILSGTIGTKYFDANHMEKVGAASIVIAGGITVATIAEICLFVGTTALAAYGLYEGYENREEIARFGKEFIDSCGDTVDGWVAQIVDASGQDYVFGSEALELVQDTEWSVIQGGLPPEGDPNKKDDKDKDKFHIPGDPMTHVAQFTALGATWFTTNAKNIYQEWCDILDGWKGKDTPIPQNNVLYNNFPQMVSDVDIAAQWSGQEFYYSFSGTAVRMTSQGTISCIDSISSYRTVDFPVAGYITKQGGAGGTLLYSVWFCSGSKADVCHFSADVTRILSDGSSNTSSSNYQSGFGVVDLNSGETLVYGANFPIFSTKAAAQSYLNGNTPASAALNYGKSFRIADWLQQDWAGQLIDPLVNIGLTLTQLIDVMKQLGLKTLQGLTAEQLLELLQKVLPRIDPGLLPDATPAPAVDPALEPVYYPDPEPVPLPDMDAADYKVELTAVFPFCIPFDFIALLEALAAEPRAPCFTFPVVIPALNYREDVKLDLAVFDDVAGVIRLCEKVSFILFLMFVTSKVIRW